MPRGLLLDAAPKDWAALADRIGAATLNINHAGETAESLRAYRATGRQVLVYTVNDPAAAKRWLDAGAAAIIVTHDRAQAGRWATRTWEHR